MRGDAVFTQELQTMARSLRKEIQEELLRTKPNMERLGRLQRTLADLESAVCNVLGAME